MKLSGQIKTIKYMESAIHGNDSNYADVFAIRYKGWRLKIAGES